MANNLGDLKARIIAETDRDDLGPGQPLEQQLLGSIQRAIDYHSDEAFWFNLHSAPAAVAGGWDTVVRPYAIRITERVLLDGCPLRKMSLAEIERIRGSGRPSAWSNDGDLIRLRPVPDGSFSLTVAGVAQIDAPENDSDESVWTTQAQDLIAARTRFLLFRDVFRDSEGTQLAAQAEGEALTKLRRETRRRGAMPLRAIGDEPWTARGFDISRG